MKNHIKEKVKELVKKFSENENRSITQKKGKIRINGKFSPLKKDEKELIRTVIERNKKLYNFLFERRVKKVDSGVFTDNDLFSRLEKEIDAENNRLYECIGINRDADGFVRCNECLKLFHPILHCAIANFEFCSQHQQYKQFKNN